MNIPNLPTDNLYKFAALFGLAGYIAIVIFIGSYRLKIIESSTELKLEKTELSHRMRKLSNVIEKLNRINSNINENNIDLDSELTSDLRLIDYYIDSTKMAMELDKEKFNVKVDSNISYIDELSWYFWFLIFMAICLLFLSACGFALWYLRVQKYLDIKIKNDSSYNE